MFKKPIVGEGQTQIDFNPIDSVKAEIVPIEVEPESSLSQLFRAHGTTEEKFDDYADKRGCSSHEAYMHFGISKDEVDNMSTYYPVGEVVEAIPKDENDIEKVVGPSILIAKRALHLTNALVQYSKASQANGFSRALDTPHAKKLYSRYSENGLARIIGSQGPRKSSGDAEFLKAIGSQEMIDAGERPSVVGYTGQIEADKFIKEYVGSKNKSDREKFRRVLKKQEKNFKKS